MKKMQDAGCRMQDAGCRMQDAGCRMQDAGCRMQDAGCRMQGAGCRVQDVTPLCPLFDKGGMKGGLFAKWGHHALRITHHASRITHHALRNERGIALVMVMILSTIALAVMAGLIYMVTSGTQISGMHKRYSTAFEAGLGGIDVTYQVILLRGDATNTASFLSMLTNGTGTTPASCVTLSSDASCTAIGSYTGIAAKLNLPTSCWSGCDSSMTINTATSTSYDIRFDLGSYRVYTKIVDTVVGNSGGDEGLIKGGVVTSNTGEITVMSVPYLYTIEVDSENPNNPAERAKLSILYQY